MAEEEFAVNKTLTGAMMSASAYFGLLLSGLLKLKLEV